jgi:Predicted ATP-binding protein involved in virulence
MRLKSIQLQNFRCYEDLKIELDKNFNIILGINGTGKTAILEAARIAIGSLYSEFDKIENKISSPGINTDDVRLHNGERQYEVHILTEACVSESISSSLMKNEPIIWERTLERYGGRTKFVGAEEIKAVSKRIQKIVRNSGTQNIPLIAYYSTDRYKKEKKNMGLDADGSRLRGYYNSLDAMTNVWFFLNIYKTETLSELQHSEKSVLLAVVNNAVISCIDDCETLYHDVKKDELIIVLKNNGESIPFHMLSDGVRSTLAMVMEIAFRCYLLNPHLDELAAKETAGVVLIDEIDLHLHPAWQKRIINDLRKAFPQLQFIVTTHAPLVIGSLKSGKIFNISDRQAYDFPIQYGKDANSILIEMKTSEMDDEIKKKIEAYFLLIEGGKGKIEPALQLRAELESLLGENHSEMQRADIMLNFF